MYEENENRIDWKNIIKKIIFVLIVILVIFGIITLISRCSKKENKPINNEENISLKSQLDEFESATIKYLTKENLPVEINSSKTIRLKLLINKELTENIKDSNNKVCDINESYAEVTRLENNYAVKLSLTCGTKKDYRVIYVGCFDKCNGNVCKGEESSKGVCTTTTIDNDKEDNKDNNNKVNNSENKKPIANNTTTNNKPTINSNNNSNNNNSSNTNTTSKITLYEFKRCSYSCDYGVMNSDGYCETRRNPLLSYESYSNSSIPFNNKQDYIGYEFEGYANGQYKYIKYSCDSNEKFDYISRKCIKESRANKSCTTTWSKYTTLDGWTRTGNTK